MSSINATHKKIVNISDHPVPLNRPSDSEKKLSNLMGQIIGDKEKNIQKSLKNRVNIFEGILIGGDAFNMGYATFEGVQAVKTSIANIPAVKTATMLCGTIAGVINIAVALICLKEGIQALNNGDKKLGMRLLLGSICYFVIGAVMMLASLGLRVSALSSVSALLTANPWILPVAFFVASIPTMIEIVSRLVNSCRNMDYASELRTSPNDLIQGEKEENPFHLQPLIKMLKDNSDQENEVLSKLSEKMEKLQADMGVKAAVEAFKLLKDAIDKKDTSTQLEKTKNEIEKWKKAQWVRLGQQALYLAAFGVSMGRLNHLFNTQAVKGSQSFASGAANAIPLGMDIFWPFKRNAPIVVPKFEGENSPPSQPIDQSVLSA